MKTSPRTLEEVVQKFQRIRALNQGRRIHLPKELWKEVFDLTNTYYVAEIAAALGISIQYLKRRLEKQPKVILGFTQAQVLNNKNQSLIELMIKRQEHPITLRWTGLIKELPLLIEKLFRGEFS